MRVLALVLVLSATVPSHAEFSPDPWLEDLKQVQAEISGHYANLESMLADRRIDLVRVRTLAEEQIRSAKNETQARDAIDWFVRQLGDGHALVRWPSTATPATATDEKDTRPLCARLGYSRRDPAGLDFTRFPEFTPLAGDDATFFPGGILRLSESKKLGVLRIHLFSESEHPELCESVRKARGLADDATCEGECRHSVDRDVANLLTAALERRVEALRAAGATALAVDLTGNGGGSDWVEPAARVLTPVALRSPRLSFLKHPHWRKQLRERLADVEADLAAGREPRTVLEQAAGTLREAIARADESCDRSGLWSDPPKAPDCSLVVSGRLYSSGVLPYAKPSLFSEELVSRHTLFHPSQYEYREGVNRLPLYVVVDAGTGSAAEQFAAMMQDNRAAVLIGLPTAGAGCGHTNGGIPAKLGRSGGDLRLPDCVRLRADGSNEVLSVMPEVLVPWRGRDSRYQRAVRAFAALRGAVK